MAMDRNTTLLAVTVVLYLIIIILGFPQVVGIGLAVNRLHGCPLFTEFGQYGAFFGSLQHCNYVTYMPIIVSLVYGIIQFIYHLFALVQALRRPETLIGLSSTPLVPVVVLTLAAFILTLIGAGLTSGGLYYFCQSNRALMIHYFGLPITCTAGELTSKLFRGYDPYYDLLGTETCYWLSSIAWLALLIVTILRVVLSRRVQTSGVGRPTEAFRGVTLLPDKYRQTGTKVETIPSSGGSMAQFETKVKPMETAA